MIGSDFNRVIDRVVILSVIGIIATATAIVIGVPMLVWWIVDHVRII